MTRIYESEIEQIALELLRDENGYSVLYGPDLAEGAQPERTYSEVRFAIFSDMLLPKFMRGDMRLIE